MTGTERQTEYLTTKEAMEIFKVSRLTLYRWIDAGKLQASKMPGGQWRIPREAVDALLEGRDMA